MFELNMIRKALGKGSPRAIVPCLSLPLQVPVLLCLQCDLWETRQVHTVTGLIVWWRVTCILFYLYHRQHHIILKKLMHNDCHWLYYVHVQMNMGIAFQSSWYTHVQIWYPIMWFCMNYMYGLVNSAPGKYLVFAFTFRSKHPKSKMLEYRAKYSTSCFFFI